MMLTVLGWIAAAYVSFCVFFLLVTWLRSYRCAWCGAPYAVWHRANARTCDQCKLEIDYRLEAATRIGAARRRHLMREW